MSNSGDSKQDFGSILENFERRQEVSGRERPSGTLIRQQPKTKPVGSAATPPLAVEIDDEDFGAALARFDQEGPAQQERVPKPGNRLTGVILSMNMEVAFVDIGAKAEALIPTIELADDDGMLEFRSGDDIEVEVIGRHDGSVRLRRLGSLSSGELPAVGDEIEGLVKEVNKGGVEVEIGQVRAFCPFSQLADHYVEDAQAFVGRKLRFEVQRAEPGKHGRKDNLVLSRRVLLEREKRARQQAALDGLELGAVVRGKVTSLADYGAFVDIGGIEGLVHVSELSHRRLSHPSEMLEVGQEVDLRVTKLEQGQDGKPRISLSSKALERDPWIDSVARYARGSVYPGRVVRLEAFGAFVELEPGVEGLAHISELGQGRRIHHPREVVSVGQELPVRVLELDATKKRISLARADDNELPEATAEMHQALARSKDKASSSGFGSMASLFEKARQSKD